ncbi:MAG: ethanolamine utilization cobalamin adenosyltransferase [Desulforhopalus sp.]|jgi:ethanolamine utilization cobalamin adenosyltransferase
MKKKLVSADNISDFLSAGASELHVDNSMIITSGAKDYLRDKGIKLVYFKQIAGATRPANCKVSGGQDLKAVVTKIVSILRNDFQVKDAATVESVTQKVLSGLKRQ